MLTLMRFLKPRVVKNVLFGVFGTYCKTCDEKFNTIVPMTIHLSVMCLHCSFCFLLLIFFYSKAYTRQMHSGDSLWVVQLLSHFALLFNKLYSHYPTHLHSSTSKVRFRCFNAANTMWEHFKTHFPFFDRQWHMCRRIWIMISFDGKGNSEIPKLLSN